MTIKLIILSNDVSLVQKILPFVPNFFEFLELKDYINYDTALCNKLERNELIIFRSNYELIFEFKNYFYDTNIKKVINSLIKKNIFLKNIYIDPSLNDIIKKVIYTRYLINNNFDVSNFYVFNFKKIENEIPNLLMYKNNNILKKKEILYINKFNNNEKLLLIYINFFSKIKKIELNWRCKYINFIDYKIFDNLECIKFAKNHNENHTIINFLNLYDNLTNIDLRNCAGINDYTLNIITNSCKNLKNINLGGCFNITDDGIILLINNKKNLEFISVSNCQKLTDRSLIKLSECINLKKVYVSNCTKITNKFLIKLSESCKKLVQLDLSNCYLISNKGLLFIIRNNKNLIYINVFNCKKITNKIIPQIKQYCNKIKYVNLGNCPKINKDELNRNILKL